jgi:5-methylcytosine-specific restriction endonuclease McrA
MTTQAWQQIYDDYMKSEEWQAKREKVLIFWGRRCALCNSPDNVQVHHRTYDRLGQELITDLIPLCKVCHDRHHEFMRHGLEHVSAPLYRFAEGIRNG